MKLALTLLMFTINTNHSYDFKLEIRDDQGLKVYKPKGDKLRIDLNSSFYFCLINKPTEVTKLPLVVSRKLECKNRASKDRFETNLICDPSVPKTYFNWSLYDSGYNKSFQFLYSCELIKS